MNAPLVANAADRRQVKHAGRKDKDRRTTELDELRNLLTIPEFRRFCWRLMGQCGYGENPSRARGDETHQNIGKADIARWMISEFGLAGAIKQWLLMQEEAWHAKQNEALEAEAVRTPSAQRTASQQSSDDA